MLNFAENGDEAATLLVLSGRLDSHAAESFGARLNAILDRAPKALLLDCAELTFLSSAGIRELVRAVKRCRSGGTAIALCSASDNIRSVLDISGMSKVLVVHSSRDAGLAALTR